MYPYYVNPAWYFPYYDPLFGYTIWVWPQCPICGRFMIRQQQTDQNGKVTTIYFCTNPAHA